jgi:hypothetical protein
MQDASPFRARSTASRFSASERGAARKWPAWIRIRNFSPAARRVPRRSRSRPERSPTHPGSRARGHQCQTLPLFTSAAWLAELLTGWPAIWELYNTHDAPVDTMRIAAAKGVLGVPVWAAKETLSQAALPPGSCRLKRHGEKSDVRTGVDWARAPAGLSR